MSGFKAVSTNLPANIGWAFAHQPLRKAPPVDCPPLSNANGSSVGDQMFRPGSRALAATATGASACGWWWCAEDTAALPSVRANLQWQAKLLRYWRRMGGGMLAFAD